MIASAGCETLDEFMAFTTLTICYNSKRLVENGTECPTRCHIFYDVWELSSWCMTSIFFLSHDCPFSASGVEIAFIKKDCLIYQLIVWKLSRLVVVKRP